MAVLTPSEIQENINAIVEQSKAQGKSDDEIAGVVESYQAHIRGEITEDKRGPFKRLASKLRFKVQEPGVASGMTPIETADVLVSGAQFAGQFTPFSPATEALGTAAKDLLKGKDSKKAILNGISAGLIDGTLLLAAGGIGKIGGKIVNRAIKKGGKIGGKVGEAIKSNPKLLKPTKVRLDQIANRAIEGIKPLKQKTGALVGELKKQLRKVDIGLDNSKLLFEFNQEAVDRGLVKKQLIKKTGQETSQLNPKMAGVDALQEFTGNFQTKQSFTNAEEALDVIAGSKPYQRIFEKQAKGLDLQKGEGLALEMLNRYRRVVNSQIDDKLFDAGLIKAKGEYRTIKSAIREIRGLKTDTVSKKLANAMKEGNTDIFDAFKSLDDMVPAESKFLDDAVRSLVGNPANEIQLKLGIDLIRSLLTPATRTAMQFGKTGVPSVVGAATRRTASELGAEPLTEFVTEPVVEAAKPLIRRKKEQ